MSNNNTLEYFAQDEPPKQEPPQEDFLEGICGRCLDTGFVHDTRNGILGILYTTYNQDANGQPIKKLMVCNHNKNMNI